MSRRVLVVGGGIIGLAVAERVLRDDPSARVTVLEKESGWARHQTGRNSGVVHSGLYYPPGSAKARWCRTGASQLLAFAEAEGVDHAVTGKLVVATDPAELPRLEALRRRGVANGLAVRRSTVPRPSSTNRTSPPSRRSTSRRPASSTTRGPAPHWSGGSRAPEPTCGSARRFSRPTRAPTRWPSRPQQAQ